MLVGQMLGDGKRLHLQHGPIDLIVEATGQPEQVQRAYSEAASCFQKILQELVDELPVLRAPVTTDDQGSQSVSGLIARRMVQAVSPYAAECYVTPMAAVAGSVADYVLKKMWASTRLDRAYVNNGGDIALALTPAARFTVAVCADPVLGTDGGRLTISYGDGIGGIATSGWRGRSHSLGIADAVTVLAGSAASADVAATLIANAVDLPATDGRVRRVPASTLSPDTDLGDQLVTEAVDPLDAVSIEAALARGIDFAKLLCDQRRIAGAVLNLQGCTRVVGVTPSATGSDRIQMVGGLHSPTPIESDSDTQQEQAGAIC